MTTAAPPCPICNGDRLSPDARSEMRRLALAAGLDRLEPNPGGAVLYSHKAGPAMLQIGDQCDSCDLALVRTTLEKRARAAATPKISLVDQTAAAARELRMRERVYPRWVESGKMSQAQADREIAAMRAIEQTLTELRDAVPPAQSQLI